MNGSDAGQKVRLRYMAGDPSDAAGAGKSPLEGWDYQALEPMLDGPVTRRVAIVDLDPENGTLLPGAPFLPPRRGRALGTYRIADATRSDASDFQQVSVFGAVMKMIDMFEEPDVLGRPLRWAFNGEQLLVVPRAGRMGNAFYHRDSRSLQFFFFDAQVDGATRTIYTCLSPDIVAHETTHAILDGIAPDLNDASSPQSLAIHEAMADLGAVIFALRTANLRKRVLELTGGYLTRSVAFNRIAEQFGAALAGSERPLRDLFNDASLGSWGTPPASREPHDLSTVLSGALYSLLVEEHQRAKVKVLEESGQTGEEAEFKASGKALFMAGEKFKRMAFRTLDYLAPGEVSFADYGRALIASDLASNPDNAAGREFVKAEFVRRGIVGSAAALDPLPSGLSLPVGLDLDLLVRSDWAAYQFAEGHRAALLIPPGVPYEVRPRLDVRRETYRHGGEKAIVRQCIFKVAWRETQLVSSFGGLIDEISVTYGTTLVIDRQTRTVVALLSTNPQHASQQGTEVAQNQRMREAFIAACLEDGRLEIGASNVQIQDRQMRLRGTAQMLHMTGE